LIVIGEIEKKRKTEEREEREEKRTKIRKREKKGAGRNHDCPDHPRY
jgi:hypothetical protein